MRRWSVLVAVFLLAGCSGKAPAPVDDVPVVGSLLIDVRTEAGLPVPGARASILGTDAFGDTNASGLVLLAGITPGEHRLSVQESGFDPFTADVLVAANKTTRVEVTLFLTRAGNPPHVHDHWLGKTTYTLMDAEVDITRFSEGSYPEIEDPVFGPTLLPNGWSDGDFKIPILETPEDGPTLVLPGTKRLDITLDWDQSDMSIEEFGVKIDPSGGDEFTTYDPVGPGGTISLDVTPEMWDDAHRGFSRWNVWGYHTNDMTEPADWNPSLAAPLQVTMVLTKGNLSLDPAHKDFWGDNTTIRLLEADGRVSSTPPLTFGFAGKTFRLNEDIVPPGTGTLRLEFFWEGHDTTVPVPNMDFQLWWTSPDQNPQTTTRNDAWTVEPVAGSSAEQRLIYELDLTPEQTDGFYDTRSGWDFYGRHDSYNDLRASAYTWYHMGLIVDAIKAP